MLEWNFQASSLSLGFSFRRNVFNKRKQTIATTKLTIRIGEGKWKANRRRQQQQQQKLLCSHEISNLCRFFVFVLLTACKCTNLNEKIKWKKWRKPNSFNHILTIFLRTLVYSSTLIKKIRYSIKFDGYGLGVLCTYVPKLIFAYLSLLSNVRTSQWCTTP